MTHSFVELAINAYADYEKKKIEKKYPSSKKIIPNYVMKRHIVIYNNDEKVFDSDTVNKIPKNVQMAIKSYGIPEKIKPNNKTPLIYHVKTTLSSMFPDKETEDRFMNSKCLSKL